MEDPGHIKFSHTQLRVYASLWWDPLQKKESDEGKRKDKDLEQDGFQAQG